jgi:glutamate racemase
VIGTLGTIGSGAYDKAIKSLSPSAAVVARACPLFVPLVEEGWTEHPAARLIAEEYLAPLADARVDTLVLGCTHYPLLKGLIGEVVGRQVRLIDSAEETAAETGRVLAEAGLRAPATAVARHRFVASDAPDHFTRLAGRFLGTALEGVETVTLG